MISIRDNFEMFMKYKNAVQYAQIYKPNFHSLVVTYVFHTKY